MFKLLCDSVIYPFLLRPVYLFSYFVLCIFQVKKWKTVFDTWENKTAQNRVQFFKTLYLNHRCFPYSQAKKYPVYVYSDVEIISLSGNVFLDCDHVEQGMIRWGWFHTFRSQGKTRINIQGTLNLCGGGRFFKGSEIAVWKDAVLTIGNGFFVGENSSIYCWKKILIGPYLCLSYQSQIFDTDFHYSINTTTGEVKERCKPIEIGAYNWIGCQTTIKKGTITPDHLIVAASGSLLGKDYRKSVAEYSIIGGSPAKLLSSNYSRIWNKEYERMEEIDFWYNGVNSEIFAYDLSNQNISEYSECQ